MIPAVTKEKNQKSLSEACKRLDPVIGHTPLVSFSEFSPSPEVELFAKLEWKQAGGSVKTRPAFYIIKDALDNGNLNRGKKILDASSGNTGIAYALIGRKLGLEVDICIPENASDERKQLIRDLGATLHLTPMTGSTDEAQDHARALVQRHPGRYFYADQYNNDSNWKAHFYTTGKEILDQTHRRITHFVAGLGTTGTFTGTGRRLQSELPGVRLIALQPDLPMHGLEGWKHLETARVPGIYDSSLADELLEISTDQAYDLLKKVARIKQLVISPSSAANLAGALEVAKKLDKGVVVTVFPDDGSRYGEITGELLKVS